MRGDIPGYNIRVPLTLNQALDVLHNEPGKWTPLAGGTDLMVLLETGVLKQKNLLSILGLSELTGISEANGKIVIGGATSFAKIRDNSIVREEFPILSSAAESVGAVAIQNRATIAGNIANASPASDSAPALLAYDAEIELLSVSGPRRIRYVDFHLGYKKTAIRPNELIRAIILPRASAGDPLARRHFFRKVGTRKAQAISKLCFAGVIEFVAGGTSSSSRQIREVRIALGAVAPTVVRCTQTENLLNGNELTRELILLARDTLAREIAPISDIRSTAAYRSRVACNVLEQFLNSVMAN